MRAGSRFHESAVFGRLQSVGIQEMTNIYAKLCKLLLLEDLRNLTVLNRRISHLLLPEKPAGKTASLDCMKKGATNSLSRR
jgi:hypothetical protein